MSFTVSPTNVALNTPVTRVTLKLRTEMPQVKPVENHDVKLKSLFIDMKNACNTLPVQHRKEYFQRISVWEYKLTQELHVDSPVDADRLKAAYALCILQYSTVEHVMINIAESDEEKAVWLGFYENVQEILAQVLPADYTVEQFIERFRQQQAEKKYLSALAEVRATFERLEEDLCSRANQVNEMFIARFEELKSELLDVHEESSRYTRQNHRRLDLLTESVNQLFQKLQKHLDEAKVIEQAMEQQEGDLSRNLLDIENLLRKVK
jgi:hypothetical protein